MSFLTYTRRLPLWIYILLFGFITFYTYEIEISSDMAWYMNAALNVFQGKGYTNINGTLILERGPIFPLMISASYFLFGVSAWSAFWVVRLFAIGNLVLIYFLGKKLYGKWIGFAAALLILSSYSVNYWSYRHIDAVLSFWSILSIMCLYDALEKRRHLLFLLSGFLMAFSYLVKQSAILLWPLPIVLIIAVNNYRNKKCVLGFIIYMLAIVVSIFPWLYYIQLYSGNMTSIVLGPGGERAVYGTVNSGFLGNYIYGFTTYCFGGSQSLSANFILAPLFVFSWLYTAYRGFKREKESILLLALLLLLSPLIAHAGKNNLRVGQLLLFILPTYLITTRFCLDLSEKIVGSNSVAGWFPRHVLGVALIAALVVIQTVASYRDDKGNIRFMKRNFFYQSMIKGKKDKKIVGELDELSKKCGEWIKETLPKGSKLLVSNPIEGKSVYFYSDGKCPVYVMPVIKSNRMPEKINSNKRNSIIFISAWTTKVDPRNKIFLLKEDDLLVYIRENQIDYVIVHKMRNYLSQYFELNDSFSKVIEFGNGAIKVYKIDNARPIGEFRMMISKKLITYLKNLMNNDSEKFVWYVNEFFEPLLNWNNEKVKELIQLNNDGIFQNAVVVRENKIYHSL